MWKPNRTMLAVLCACPAGVAAVEVGDLTIGGYLDADVTYADSSATDDPSLDFASNFELQLTYAIGEAVTATAHIDFFDTGSGELETGVVKWALTDQAAVMMGQYINAIGWEAADTPERYLITRSILVTQGFYGAATNAGIAAIYEPSEAMQLKVFLQDHVYGDGTKGASDAIAMVADAVLDIEGYGSVNAEIVIDQENAAAFGGPVDADLTSFSVNATMTAINNLIVGAEAFFVDYDTANALAGMIQINYAFTENISATARLALVEPNDDGEDDDGGEVAFALLTNPTGDSNFAVNCEFTRASFDDTSNTDKATYAFTIAVLAVIP